MLEQGEACWLCICRTKREKGPKGCDAPNINYDEAALLQQLINFRWQDFFGNPKHDAERATAAAEVERLGLEVQRIQGVISNLHDATSIAGTTADCSNT